MRAESEHLITFFEEIRYTMGKVEPQVWITEERKKLNLDLTAHFTSCFEVVFYCIIEIHSIIESLTFHKKGYFVHV